MPRQIPVISELYERFTACHVEREGSGKDLLDSFRLRFDVFCHEKRFLDAEDYPDHCEYDCFDKLSEHIVVRECESEKLVGTVRLVRYSNELGFPTAHHFSNLYATLADVPLDKIYEVSRLCILPLFRQRLMPKDRRNGIVLISIIKKMYQIVASLGGNYLIASMEDCLIRYLSMFGIESLRLSNDYIDFHGQVIPCIIRINKTLDRISQKRPEQQDFFIHDDRKKMGFSPMPASIFLRKSLFSLQDRI